MPRVVLVNPLIPPNTGNIARTCAATDTDLHLVGPLGFQLSDRHLKRAGLDYWPYVKLFVHESWPAFRKAQQTLGGRCIGFSTSGRCNYIKLNFYPDDWLLFGSETEGLSSEVLVACDQTAFIPMIGQHVRSLNLSVSTAIGLFEALRQTNQLKCANPPKGRNQSR